MTASVWYPMPSQAFIFFYFLQVPFIATAICILTKVVRLVLSHFEKASRYLQIFSYIFKYFDIFKNTFLETF